MNEPLKQAFKAGFLLRCAEERLSPAEIESRVAMSKSAAGALSPVLSAIFAPFSGAAKGLAAAVPQAAITTLAAAPLLAGAGGGYLVGKLRNEAEEGSAEILRREGVLLEYERMLREAQRKEELEKMRKELPGEIVQLS